MKFISLVHKVIQASSSGTKETLLHHFSKLKILVVLNIETTSSGNGS